jgi:SAM-dependent methyltransferase
MADALRSRAAVWTAPVWQGLRAAVEERTGSGPLTVLDVGGGTGGFAVPFAELGHLVTVVDPSPDSLAALDRRAAEAGVAERVRGRQGDAANLAELVEPGGCDVALCHSVLEVVDDPGQAMAGLARALRPGGVASVLTAGRVGAVLARALAGRFGEAVHLLVDPAGRFGPRDPLARRFDVDALLALVRAAGLRPGQVHGVRVFSDLLPGGAPETDQAGLAELVELETRAGELPVYRDIATQLHLLAFG